MIYFKLRDILTKILCAAQYIVFFLLTSENKFLYITLHLREKAKQIFQGEFQKTLPNLKFLMQETSKNSKI